MVGAGNRPAQCVTVGRWQRTLLAGVAAVALHLLVLGVFADWRLAPTPPSEKPHSLDVVLATRPALEPDAAQAIAEASQQARRSNTAAVEPAPQVESGPPAKSSEPEPAPTPEPSPKPESATEPATEPASQPPPGPEAPAGAGGANNAPSGRALLTQATDSVRQQGFEASAWADGEGGHNQTAARRAAEARYIDAWTRRVETYGNRHYPAPDAVDGQLRIRVVIGRDGQVRQAEVLQSSGHPELDQAALKTVHGAAPYRPFDRGMGERDSLAITRVWRFGKGNSFGVH